MRPFPYAFLLIAILFLLQCGFACASENSIYIWQRKWDTQIEDSIKAVRPQTECFVVLSGEARLEQQRLSLSHISISWPCLKDARVTIAFRLNAQISKLLQTDSACQNLIKEIKRIIDSQITAAAKEGVTIIGVQFDYDCPTSKLSDYTRFVKNCHKELPSLEMSVTVLPTWLDSKNLEELISPTTYYVLQLHSFELPKDLNQARSIFLTDKATLYVSQADRHEHPYYISLPTYGYEVAFSDNGKKFVGLRAENASVLWGKNIRYETVMADPDTILAFIRQLEINPPRNLVGICWFRLPLKYDEFNWDIKTLRAVMAGKRPSANLKTEEEISKDGLHEIYLLNVGERNILSQLSFRLTWTNEAQPLYDILGEYQGYIIDGGSGLLVKGPAPKVGEKVLVGWFRNTDKSRRLTLDISEVAIDEKN